MYAAQRQAPEWACVRGLEAIYSGSCRESALLIVRAKGEWKMCLSLLPRRWGWGLRCWRHAGLVLVPPPPGSPKGPLLSGQQLSQGFVAYLRLKRIPFSSTLHLRVAGCGSGRPGTNRFGGAMGRVYVTEMAFSCRESVWPSLCHRLHFWKLKKVSWQ